MTDDTAPEPGEAPTSKPRIALMGEFSAGKSTLANLLLERQSSPVQVTATQLPPVWYRHGDGQAERIALDGARHDMPLDDWGAHSPQDTQMIFVGLDCDILEAADIIDMPGTSDPSLTVQYWQTVLPLVDVVIWCTPANQAWRQSEAALWEEVAMDLKRRSLLLVTRIDQVRSATDATRILQRVRHEAGNEFGAVLPISLTDALASPQDEAALEACGAADMVRYLVRMIETVGERRRPAFEPVNLAPDPSAAIARPDKPAGKIVPRQITRRKIACPARRMA